MPNDTRKKRGDAIEKSFKGASGASGLKRGILLLFGKKPKKIREAASRPSQKKKPKKR